MTEVPQPWNITHESTCEEANCGCLVRALQAELAAARAELAGRSPCAAHLARAEAAELDKANLAREVDHLQRESAHAHGRIAAALVECCGSDPSCPSSIHRALIGGTGQ